MTGLVHFVRELLSFLQHDWICEFLCYRGAVADLTVLTSESHINYAFAGKIRKLFSSSEANETPPSEQFDADWVFVPALSIGHFTSFLILREMDRNSLAMHQRFVGTDHCARSPVRLKIFHAVRNDITGSMCTCSSHDTRTDVDIMVLVNDVVSHKRARGLFRVPRSALRSRNVFEIVSNVSFLVSVQEKRSCMCGHVCHCPPVLLRRASHPMDFTTSQYNLHALAGGYNGVVSTMVLERGQLKRNGNTFDFAGTIAGGNAPGTIPRLLSWAGSHLLACALASAPPSHLPMPLVSAAHSRIGENLRLLSASESNVPVHARLEQSVAIRPDELLVSSPPKPKPTELSNSALPVSTDLLFDEDLDVLSFMLNGGSAASGSSIPVSQESSRICVGSTPAPSTENAPLAEGSHPTSTNITPASLTPSSSLQPPPSNCDSAEAKEQRRKVRNRMSAQKSNRRRQELKTLIANAKESSDALRKRLEKLREENAKLRAQLALPADQPVFSSLFHRWSTNEYGIEQQ